MCFRRSSERTCALLSDRGQPPLRHLQRRLLHAWPPLQGTWPVEIEKRMQRLPCFVAGLQLHDRTDTPLRLLCGTEPAHGAPAAMLGFSETLRNLHRHGSKCQPEAFSNLRTPRHCFKGFGVSDVSVCLNARLPARHMHAPGTTLHCPACRSKTTIARAATAATSSAESAARQGMCT